MIWGIVLAAGESKRMGKPKLLLPFGKKTIIETVAQNVLQSNLDKVLIVLGSDQEKIEEKIKKFPIKIVINPNFFRGMLSSVIYGFETIPKRAKVALIILGDQPSVSSTIINRLIDEYKKTKKGIILPVYKNKRGHPTLIDLKYRDEIKRLNPNIGLRELIHNHPEDIQEVKCNTSIILQDIDTQDDYHEELKTIK